MQKQLHTERVHHGSTYNQILSFVVFDAQAAHCVNDHVHSIHFRLMSG